MASDEKTLRELLEYGQYSSIYCGYLSLW